MKHESVKPAKEVSIKEAKNRLPALIRAVEEGEHIVITRNGKPVVEIVRHVRKGGIDWEGLRRWKQENGIDQIVGEMSDDFNDPLPEDFLIRPMP